MTIEYRRRPLTEQEQKYRERLVQFHMGILGVERQEAEFITAITEGHPVEAVLNDKVQLRLYALSND